MKIRKGSKYYRFLDNGETEIIRINKMKGTDYSVLLDSDKTKKEYKKLTEQEIKENYTLLRPDGYITFSIVKLMNDIKDVLVVLHRKQDIETPEGLPYAVCRQGVTDVFSNQFVSGTDIKFVGISVSTDTCPIDIDFRMFLSCDAIIGNAMDMVSVYLDDTLDDILSFVNKRKYDSVLTGLNSNIGASSRIMGGCDSLKELLVDNSFMYDFYKGFGIQLLPFIIDKEEQFISNPVEVEYLEDLVKSCISATYVIPFSKDINLSMIKKDYVIVADAKGKIFIIGYDKDNSRKREYKNVDKLSIDAMVKIGHSYKNK